MSITNHQTLRLAGICFVGLLLLSGCKRSSVGPHTAKALTGLSQPIRVSSGDGDAAEPAIAASPDGSVYVTWVNHGAKMQADLMIARFSGDGQMQGSPVRVNLQPGTATAWRGDPPTVAVAPDHTVYVGWTARVESKSAHATNIYLSSSRDQGQTFGPPVKVNDDIKPAMHGMHSLAIGSNGRVYLAWLDERNVAPVEGKDMDPKMKGHMESNSELFFSSSGDGGRTFTSNRRVATDVCPCCKTTLAIAPDNRVYLSWRQVLPGDFRHIAVSSSADSGETFSNTVIVSDDQWMIKGCPVSGASLSVDAARLRVLWYAAGEKGEHGIYYSESRDAGQTFSPRRLITETNAFGTPVLLNEPDVLAVGVWESGADGSGQVFAARLPGGTNVVTEPHTVGDGELPSATMANGRLFIVDLVKQGSRQNIQLVSVPKANLLD
jgi:hypothetical protein